MMSTADKAKCLALALSSVDTSKCLALDVGGLDRCDG
jgi:hypothetical protein